MDIRGLECFRTVAELGSISKAAAFLRLAQPALSRQIQRLEHSLGVQLLQRSFKGVTLTPAGQLLLARTARLESTLSDIFREVGEFACEPIGPLRVGVQPSFSNTLVPDVVSRFIKEHPRVELRILAGYSADMIDGLLDETMDVVIADTPSHLPPEVTILPLWVETLHLVGPLEGRGANLFNADRVPLAEVFKLPLILPSPRYSIRRLIDQTAAREHLKVQPIVEVDGAAMIFALIKAGVGYSVMPSLGTIGYYRGKLSSVETAPTIDRPLSILVRTQLLNERKVIAFVRLFKEAVSDLSASDRFKSIRLTFGEDASGLRNDSLSAKSLKLLPPPKSGAR